MLTPTINEAWSFLLCILFSCYQLLTLHSIRSHTIVNNSNYVPDCLPVPLRGDRWHVYSPVFTNISLLRSRCLGSSLNALPLPRVTSQTTAAKETVRYQLEQQCLLLIYILLLITTKLNCGFMSISQSLIDRREETPWHLLFLSYALQRLHHPDLLNRVC